MRNVLIQQNLHWQNAHYEGLLERSLMVEIQSLLKIEEILILLGIRRSGKSTLFKLIINKLIEDCSPKSILYINFDDPFFEIAYDDSKKIYQIIETAQEITQEKIAYIFLDEIHNVSAWERFVKSNYDSKVFKKIFITGSNSKLLLSEYASLLTGRYISKRVRPLSFCEILQHKNIKTTIDIIQNKMIVDKVVKHMLQYGSYAKIFLIEDTTVKRDLLISYYDAILYKDCIKNNKIRDIKIFEQLAHYLLTHVSDPISYNGIAQILSCSDVTVREFIKILGNSFLISELNNFSFSQGKQLRQKKKYYVADNGLVYSLMFKFSDNFGKLFENLVFTELRKARHDEIYYYTDNKECDFIVKKDKELLAIQACYDINERNRDREISGLYNAMEKLNCKNGVIVTLNQEEKISDNVKIIPFWQYFC